MVSQINATFGSTFLNDRVAELKTLGADTLICGAVSRLLAEMPKCSGIKVIPFISGEVGPVIDSFLNGVLPSKEDLMTISASELRERVKAVVIVQATPFKKDGSAGGPRLLFQDCKLRSGFVSSIAGSCRRV